MKVSIVIPCYNCEEFVAQAIESVFKQEGSELEIILVDNNSTDNTLSILHDYGTRYPDTIVVLTESKKGAPAARNKGLNAATGDWVQFLDADDEILPGKFKRQLAIAESNNADIICGAYINVQVFSGKLKIIRKLYHLGRILTGKVKAEMKGYTLNTTRTPAGGDPWKALIGGKLGITSANLWKREKVAAVKGWDEGLTSSQEYDMIFRLLSLGAKISIDSTPSAIRYKLESSISSGTSSQSVLRITDNYISLRKRIISFLEKNGTLTKELKEYNNRILYSYLMRSKEIDPAAISARIKETKAEVPASLKISNFILYIFRTLFK